MSQVAKTRRLSARYIEALDRRIDGAITDGIIKRVWQTQLHVLVADARTDPLFASAHDLVRAEGYGTLSRCRCSTVTRSSRA
jgi:hypothetical protein